MEPEVDRSNCDRPVNHPIVKSKEKTMSDTTKNFFENPNSGTGWGAGVGGFIGAALAGGNGLGFGGNNREPAVTPDQMSSAIAGLQRQINTDAIQGSLGDIRADIKDAACDTTKNLGCEISGVKDAVVNGNTALNLALCNLGHNVQAGFASVNQTILLEGAKTRELTLAENLAQARAQLAAMHNQVGHTATQTMIQQVINSGNV